MTDPILSLRSFGVSFGERVILEDVNLDLPRAGMTVLVGPAGGGKSTLLRTLAGLNSAHPALNTWGTAVFDGQELLKGGAVGTERGRGPSHVMQHARFFLETVRENLVSALPNRSDLDKPTQTRLVSACLRANGLGDLVARLDQDAVELPLHVQRALAIVRALISRPALLFADEPTAGLDDTESVELITTLRLQAKERSVLFVTHNQRLARVAGGITLLLAGGRIQEATATAHFFAAPRTDPGRHFVRTGGCPIPEPPTLAKCTRPAAPRSFYWIEPGRLGGVARPGIIDALEDDLRGLERLRVSLLITLEEERRVDSLALERYGIHSVHFPVPDMGVPRLDHALDLCGKVRCWIDAGDVVVFHCRAGHGRTGTLLACQLIHSGATAARALESVRAINPRCVQSDAQVAFLRAFELSQSTQTERMKII